MLAFRKVFLALALVTLTMAVASAQNVPAFQCVANAGVPPIVRAEGLAELVGDIVLNCTGGYAAGTTLGPTSIPQINVQIFLNTNVTSKRMSGSDTYNEALLMIDEPRPAEQSLCNTSTGGCTVSNYPVDPALVYKPHPVTSGTPPVTSTYSPNNVFQGRRQGENSVVWLGVPIDAPGTTFTRIVRITNVRANANQLGVSSTLVPTQIVAFISATGTTSIPINNPQQTVAWIQTGVSFSVRNIVDDASGNTPLVQCISENKDLYTDTTKTNACMTLGLRFAEGFASSFKTAFISPNSAGYGSPTYSSNSQDQSIPGQIWTNSESGFFNSAWTGGQNPTEIGRATQGTRLRVAFNNVPAGIRLFVTLTNSDYASNKAAVLVNTAADGSGGYAPTTKLTTAKGGCANQYGTIGAQFNTADTKWDIAEVPIFGGAGTAVWEVTGTNSLSVETFNFGLVVSYAANTTNNLPAVGQATAAGSFAPISTVTGASVSAPVPRFADTSSARSAFSIAQCVTNILFPWVTNQGGFDTGLVISNTSKDPWGNAVQAGTCTINYYGDTNGGAAPPAQTSAVVPAGDYVAWSLYSGGKLGVVATPGFQGYVIAQCKFQYGHGYAFISDLGLSKYTAGYLALIMDKALSNRSGTSTSEVLGN